MATPQEDKQKKQQLQEFNEEQLAALGIISDEEPGKVLEAAEKVGVLQEGVGEKIDRVFEGHELKFQTALAKERRENTSDKGAFIRAFSLTYGKFILEQDDPLKKSDSSFMQTLSRVVKFPIDKKLGIKGRTELEAAAARLSKLSSDKARRDTEKRIGEKEVKKKDAEAQLPKLENDNQFLTDLFEVFNENIDITSSIKPKLEDLQKLENLGADPKTATINSQIVHQGINDVKNKLRFSGEHLEGAVSDESVEKFLPGIPEKCKRYLGDLDALLAKVTTTNEVLDFINNKYLVLINELRSAIQKEKADSDKKLSVNRNRVNTLDTQIIDLQNFEGSIIERKIQRQTEAYEEIEEAVENVLSLDTTIDTTIKDPSDIKRIFASFDNFNSNIQNLKKDPILEDRFKSLIVSYLRAFRNDLEPLRDDNTVTQFKFDLFIKDRVFPFLKNFETEFYNFIGSPDNTNPIRKVLTKAFSSVDSATIHKANHAVKNAKERVKTAEEVQTYFADDVNRNALPIAYKRFEDRLGTNGGVALIHAIDKLREEIEERKSTRDGKDRNGKFVEGDRESITDEINKKQSKIKELTALQSSAKSLHESMKIFAQYVAKLIDLGVIAKPSGINLDIKTVLNNIKSLDVDSPDFVCEKLSDIYKKLKPFYKALDFGKLDDQFHKVFARLEQDIKDTEENLKSLEGERDANTNLDDVVAAKKIIQAIVAEQYPDLPVEEQQKVASAILVDDIQTIQTEQSYQKLAEGPHAELLNTVKMVGFQGKLINFKYTVDGKDHQPFKGLTPKDFETWERMEELFNLGKLNYQNGFFALAAFELFAEGGETPKQVVELRKKLMAVLAKEFGVDERMDEAGVNKIVNDAFKEQVEKARPIIAEYFKVHGEKSPEWQRHKIDELRMKLSVYDEQLRLGKIDHDLYKLKCEQLYEESRAYDVADRFTQSSTLRGFWNHPHSQWMKDKGYEVGSYTARKVKAGIFAAGHLYLRGLWGGTKLAASTAWKTATRVPLRAIKNVGILALTPIKGLVNLKRWFWNQDYWSPFSIKKNIKEDAQAIGDFVKEKAAKTGEGTVAAFKRIPGLHWSKEQWKSKKYSERTNIDTASLESQAEELAKAGQGSLIEVESSPFVDIDKYKVQLKELDKMTSVPGAQYAKAA